MRNESKNKRSIGVKSSTGEDCVESRTSLQSKKKHAQKWWSILLLNSRMKKLQKMIKKYNNPHIDWIRAVN